jgi:mannose-1-phosphate guanylyltransferase
MAKGMILAAGQGTRVRPLTNDLPKAMVPILGKPVMEYLIEHLARYGVNEIMVNVAWHHDKIEQYFGDGHRWGVQIGYSYEGVRDHGDVLPRPMGSAGGMRRIQDFGGFFDTTTIVLCGDALIDLDIGAQSLLRCHLEIAPMIIDPSKVVETLIDKLGGFDFLVLDDHGVVVFGQCERVDTPSVLRAGTHFRSYETAVKNLLKAFLNKRLELLFLIEVRLLNRRKRSRLDCEQRH